MKITFKKAYVYEGKKVKSIDLPLEDMTADQLIKIRNDFNASRRNEFAAYSSAMLLTNDEFITFAVAVLAGKRLDFIRNLPARDFALLVGAFTNFFFGSDQEAEIEEEEDEKSETPEPTEQPAQE